LIITFFFLFSVSLISYFSLGVSMSWGKKSLDVFLPFFCMKPAASPLFSVLFFSSSSPSLCCWSLLLGGRTRAEAFEFGYLIVLAFGSYACVCNAHGACLTLLERDESQCATTPAFDPANITGETDAGQQQQQQLFTISNADEVGG
jgi:hypothetical protein